MQSGGSAGDCILKKKKTKKKNELCQFVFVVVQTEFDRSNTSLKGFIFVCSQEVRPETVFYLNL